MLPKQSLLLLSLLTTPTLGLPHPQPSPADGTSANMPAPSTVDQDTMRTLQRSGRIVKLAGLIDHAERLHPGRLLEVRLERANAGYVYELQMVGERGTVRSLRYDAETGTMLEDPHGR